MDQTLLNFHASEYISLKIIVTQNGFDFSDQLIKETFVSEAMAYSKPAKALGMKTVWINQGFGALQKKIL